MKYRKALTDWLNRDDWTDWYAVTLTMSQRRKLPNGTYKTLDKTSACRNLRYALNRLNKQLYGNAFYRYNKRLQVIPVQELDTGSNLHYHLILKRPIDRTTDVEFQHAIRINWINGTYWGLWQIDIQSNVDSGWLDYITKNTSNVPNGDSKFFENVDFENLWIAE